MDVNIRGLYECVSTPLIRKLYYGSKCAMLKTNIWVEVITAVIKVVASVVNVDLLWDNAATNLAWRYQFHIHQIVYLFQPALTPANGEYRRLRSVDPRLLYHTQCPLVPACTYPMGMENGDITDSQLLISDFCITQISSYFSLYWPPGNGEWRYHRLTALSVRLLGWWWHWCLLSHKRQTQQVQCFSSV